MEIRDYANSSAPTEDIGDVNAYTKEKSRGRPLDEYLTAVEGLLDYGSPTRLSESAFLGRLLALGVVAEAENYVRFVLSHTIELCPRSRAACASQQINLGGLLWHGKAAFSRSAFEHLSFSSRDDIRKAYKNFADLQLDDATFKFVLDEYEKVCHFRHGIVHGAGFMPGRNAVTLGVKRARKLQQIEIGFGELQSIASVVGALVFTLNRQLFAELCKRWAKDWRNRPDWDPGEEDIKFRRIWRIFHSMKDKERQSGKSLITMANCKAEIESLYGLS